MKAITQGVLLFVLAAAPTWAQDIRVQGITLADIWKENIPGFEKTTYAPAIQFLNIDATQLGSEHLSLHLYGWGRVDLGEATGAEGQRRDGYLSQGYLQYRFDKANAEIKVGRITVNQSTGFEQVDGLSARTDLKGGFTLSGFFGAPVLFNPRGTLSTSEYRHQQDQILGTRLGWRGVKGLEVGISYLQDGSRSAREAGTPLGQDYTRQQVALDLWVTPTAAFELRGRTVLDVASHLPAISATNPSRIAEHDYTATFKVGPKLVFAGTYAERNFVPYYAGTTLPSLFKQDEQGLFQAWGGKLTWAVTDALQVVGDYRHTHREGPNAASPVGAKVDANRVGLDLRWALNDKTLLTGVGGRVVSAGPTLFVDFSAPYRSLSYQEMRAWMIQSKGKLSASLDAIFQHYETSNPYVNGLSNLYEVVGSLGYQTSPALKFSGDLSFGTTALSRAEVRALLKAEYHFGTAKKGGQ